MKNLFEMLFLLASMQGILLSLAIFLRKQNHAANIFLSVGILVMSSELFTAVYYSAGWYRDYPWFMGATYPVAYLYGPIFYLYAKLLTRKIWRVSAVNVLHFIPFIAGYIIIIPIYMMPMAERIGFVEQQMIRNPSPFIYELYEKLVPVQGIVYTILTVLLVVEYNRKIRERFSNIENINLNWLKYLILGMIVCWSFALVSHIVSLFVQGNTGFTTGLHISMSILIYSIGYLGLKQPEIFMKPVEVVATEPAPEKYGKSGLDDISAEEIKRKLLELMSLCKPYLDSELTLNALAQIMSVSNHNLSEVINTRLGKTYYDFINEYRVEEFKRRLEDPSSLSYNLISVAFDSGFNSKTAFNTIFKRATGQTPSEYRASVLSRS